MIAHRRVAVIFFMTVAGFLSSQALATAALRTGVTVDPASGAGRVTPGIGPYGVYNIDVALNGPDQPELGFVSGGKAAHCIEPDRPASGGPASLRTGIEGADLSLAGADPTNLGILPGGRDRLEWLLLSSRRALLSNPSAPERNVEAAAHQRAIFRLVSPAMPGPPGSAVSADVDAGASELLADSARFGPLVSRPAAVTAMGTDVCGGAVRTLQIIGPPLTTVVLRITGGNGNWTAGPPMAVGQALTVTLGGDGVATVSLTGIPGTLTVDATFELPTLVQADLPDGEGAGQDLVYVEVQPVHRELFVRFLDCAAPATPPAGVPTGAPPAQLRLTKSAPKVVRGRTITYTVTVTNHGSVPARGVVVTDRIPAGMSVRRVPRHARISRGVVRWAVGDLAPGARRTLRIQMRADVDGTGTRCNTVRAGADNARAVSARACTRFIRVGVARLIPAVTG